MPEEQISQTNEKAGGENERIGAGESPFGVVSEKVAPSEKVELPEIPQEKAEGKYNELLSKVSSQSKGVAATTDDDIDLDAKSIGATLDEESKVQKLLDLASTKGVVHAVKVARALKDYYALDMMHDSLADKLYQGFLDKGLIEKD